MLAAYLLLDGDSMTTSTSGASVSTQSGEHVEMHALAGPWPPERMARAGVKGL